MINDLSKEKEKTDEIVEQFITLIKPTHSDKDPRNFTK